MWHHAWGGKSPGPVLEIECTLEELQHEERKLEAANPLNTGQGREAAHRLWLEVQDWSL